MRIPTKTALGAAPREVRYRRSTWPERRTIDHGLREKSTKKISIRYLIDIYSISIAGVINSFGGHAS